ncbi:MAG: hypothetical protein HC799_00055 [Limnothrix sp. RL_2_0]|nr:hypothetical protein [Limnothrix sp. RL_2_0]
MYASKPRRQLQSIQPQRQSQRPRQPLRSRQRVQQQSRRQNGVLIELGIQTSVNCLLVGVAIAAITNLLPTHISQQEQIAEIRTEVAEAEYRVKTLHKDFDENFDAYESQKLIQEHSSKVDANQKRIIWLKPTPAAE